MLDFLSSALLGGMLYDYLKLGGRIALDDLRLSLKNWLLSDDDLQSIARTVNEAPDNIKRSKESLITFIDGDQAVQEILSQLRNKETREKKVKNSHNIVIDSKISVNGDFHLGDNKNSDS